MAMTLGRKIQRQQKLGSSSKVKTLKQEQYRRRATKRAPTPDPNANVTGSTSQQDAFQPVNSPAPATPPGPAPPQGPPNPLQPSSYNPVSGQPDPRDSEYWENYATLVATSQQGYARHQLEQGQSDADYGFRLSQEGESRRRGVRDTAEGLIGTGLLRSGAHNRRQTEGTIDYLDLLSGLGRQKTDADATRGFEMKAILQNLGIDEQNLYAQAAQRYAEAQADAAANQDALAEIAAPPAEIEKAKLTQKQRRSNQKAKSQGATSKLIGKPPAGTPAKKKKKK